MINPILWLRKRWCHRLRKLDEQLLFPAFTEIAEEKGKPEIAEIMISEHKRIDPIWDSKYD